MKTAVVILNWNTKEFLSRFLPGLLDSVSSLDAGIIVADNGSADGSMELLMESFPSVRTIALGENYGFTGGYNRALAEIEAEYFVLLNSDIEVTPEWLSPLVEWMDTHPECGACGPKLHSWYERDTFEYAGAAGGYLDRFGFPYCRGRVMGKVFKDEGQYDSPADVLWVTGACLMVRSRLWKELGGLDGRFFAHMEEIDLCWRIQIAGYRVTVVPDSLVYHIGGGTLPVTSPFKLRLNYRNNLLLLENNLPLTIGRRKAARRIFVRKIIDGITAVAYIFQGKPRFFKEVVTAHREYRHLRRKPLPDSRADVTGLQPFCMIPRAFLCPEKLK